MLSFNNNPELKKKLLKEIKKHEKADAIIQGTYGEKRGGQWKGCAVGCSLRSLNIIKNTDDSTSSHQRYEDEIGIPRIIARLEDRIFENLSVEEAKKWPYKFMSAIPVGVDLSMVWPKFLYWLLVDKKDGVLKYAKTDNQKKVIQDVANLYERKIKGEMIDVNTWLEARRTDAAAAAYAADAADAAADAAAAAAAAYAAAYAAAAYAYADAAYAAAYAAAAYAYADAAYAAAYARKKATLKQSKKLLELLKNS